LRLVPFLAAYPLHRDEALYGYWARLIASGQDPLLLTPWIDKPPLTLYLISLSFRAFGVSELSLRLPGMIAGVLLIPAVYGLAAATYDRRTGLLAALLVAASPFAILFAPTAFTDPWLALFMVVALWAAVRQRAFVAGLAVGLAIASKQQGVLVAPLVAAALALTPNATPDGASPSPTSRRGRGGASAARLGVRAILGFALIFAPLTYWDSLRWHNRPSFWDRSLSTYAPLMLAPLSSWGERAAAWAQQFGYLFGHPLITASVVALAAWAVALSARSCLTPFATCGGAFPSPEFRSGEEEARRAGGEVFDLLLGGFVAAYLILHVVVTFQPWDRYLLPLVPLVCILAARGVLDCASRAGATKPERASLACAPHSRVMRAALALVVAVSLAFAAYLGMTGRLPVGSDHGAYAGLDRGIAFIAARPADAIIYHHSLGWHYNFYLFDAPQERRWYGTVWKLADDAAATHSREQWLLLPEWELNWLDDLRLALAGHGLALAETERVYRPDGSRSFVLYRIASSGGQE
jgi:hypothetical protein